MTEVETLMSAYAKLRAEAIAVGRTLEARRAEGAKMRELAGLEIAHKAAWGRYYAVDCRLHTLIGTAT
jgi:hypothetical protein